ncbi:MAG: hypothetical protein ACJAX7_001799 [Saprospiraceae bacterium]|jgi:hypothetical protein
MKKKKVAFEMLVVLILGVILEAIFFRQVVWSNFDQMIGDAGDARFNGVVLEHWWQVFQGYSNWLSPSYFYPTKGVLGYSDADFLFALPYSGLRYVGLNIFTSFQIVLLTTVFLGWTGSFIFFRYCLRLNIFPAIIGTILFSFPNAMAISVGRPQLLAIYFLPYLAIAIFLFIKNFSKKNFQGRIAGAFIAVFVPCFFYTSFYMAWFTMFFMLLLFFVFVVWLLIQKKEVKTWRTIFLNKQLWKKLLPYIVISVICFIPFFITYIPAQRVLGVRPYEEVLTMLPTFIDYINVGSSNWVWGDYFNSEELRNRPMSWELDKGLSLVLFFTFLIISIIFIRKVRNYKLQITHEGEFKMSSKKDSANTVHWQTILVIGLSLAVLLAWVLILKIEDYSLWWVISKVTPGAGAIRIVCRFQQFLVFPVAIVIAIAFNQALNIIPYIKETAVQFVILMSIAVISLFIIVEQLNTAPTSNYSKHQQLEMLSGIQAPPSDAEVFTVLPDSSLHKNPFEIHIDAMIIAQKYNLSTINGYSGSPPPGWNTTHDINDPYYSIFLNRWINYYQLNNPYLYFLNLKTGTWLSAQESNLSKSDFYPFMSEAITENSDFALQLSILKIPDNWKKNETRDCLLKAINNGNVTLSSFVADVDEPDYYGIKICYRWVKLKDVGLDPDGLTTPWSLYRHPPIKKELIWSQSITAPPEAGSYYLEMEFTQENVTWFKSKGYPGIKVKVDIL